MRDSNVPRRTLMAGAAVLACALAAARLAERAIVAFAPGGTSREPGLSPLLEVSAALPEIADGPGKKALVFGSSSVVLGFAPDEFDRRLAERGLAATSYNLGIDSPDPLTLRLLTARIRGTWEARRKRVFLSIIEFSPSDSTAAAESLLERTHALCRAELTSWGELARLFVESPGEAEELFAIKSLGTRGAPELVSVLRRSLYEGHVERTPPPPVELALARALRKIAGDGDRRRWSLERRGGRRALYPSTRAAYEAYARASARPDYAPDVARELVDSTDALELHIPGAAVADFVGAVKNLQAVSDRVFVLVSPRNPAWVTPTPAGAARLRGALARVSRETGAETLDFYDDRDFRPEDFVDPVHLNELSGRPKFMAALARRVAELWSAPAGYAERPFSRSRARMPSSESMAKTSGSVNETP